MVTAESSGQRQPEIVSTVSSSHRILVFVFLLLIFSVSAQPVSDPDFWWHLKTGEYIVDTRSIPHTDIFSTLRFGSEWVTHEWLSEVFMYGVFRVLGFGGLIVVFSLLITVAFGIAYQRCRQLARDRYIPGFVLLLAAAATLPTWGVRPQMFSLLFASIFISFLDRYSRTEAMPSIWWLAPLMVLWVNLHAGFALGLGLIVLTIVGLLLDYLLVHQYSFPEVWRHIRPLSLLLIICVAAVCLNPNGTRIYSYPFETLSSHAMMQYIEEWRSPDFHNPQFQLLSLLFFTTFSALALSSKRVRPSQLLLLAATGWATLRSGRNVVFFSLVAMPLLAEHSWILINDQPWGSRFHINDDRERAGRPAGKLILNILLFGVALGVGALAVGSAVRRQPAVETQEFPAAAINFIRQQKPPQPIFNEYTWGGYLIWKLYPDYRVYIDGRADVYGDKFVQEFLGIHDGNQAWRERLDTYGVRTVLVKPNVALASLLRQDDGWQKVFEDPQAVIFVRR